MSKPLVDNAADSEQVKKAQKKAKRDRDRELDDLRRIMDTDHGRRFIWRLLDRAGLYRTSFTGNSETFFREGMRNLGLMVQADIHEACPEKYMLMLTESKSDPS